MTDFITPLGSLIVTSPFIFFFSFLFFPLDICAFEYVSQLLIDNNAAILMLKMLSIWFQIPSQKNESHSVSNSNLNASESSSASSSRSGTLRGENIGESESDNKGPYGMATNWLKARKDPPELK